MAPKRRAAHRWAPVIHEESPAADAAVVVAEAAVAAEVVTEAAVAEYFAERDDEAFSDRTHMDGSTILGDSVVTNTDDEDGADEAAVGAGPAAPKNSVHTKKERLQRNTTPQVQGQEMSPERKEIWDQRSELPNIGNIGWLFGNWGPRPSKQGHRDNFENALRRGPAMVIGLAECQKSSEELLRRPGESAVADASLSAAMKRPACS